MKGFVTFYINTVPEMGTDIMTILDFTKSYNKEVLEKLRALDYELLFVPVVGESSRIEKLDLDAPKAGDL